MLSMTSQMILFVASLSVSELERFKEIGTTEVVQLLLQGLLTPALYLQPVVAAVGDPFYKITSEALLVTQQLVKVIRPWGE